MTILLNTRLLLSVVACLSTNLTFAQAPFRIGPTTTRHQVGVGAGLEPELTTSIGYAYRLNPGNQSVQYQVGASLTVPPYQLSNGSGRANLLLALNWQRPGRWGGRLALLPYYARNQNEAGQMNGVGLEIRLMPLHRGNRWTSGPDLGWQGTLLTRIRHSDRVRTTFTDRYSGAANSNFSGPIDGWYGTTAQRFRLGCTGGRQLGQHLRGQFSAGSLLSLQRQGLLLSFAHGQIPLYAEIAFTVGW